MMMTSTPQMMMMVPSSIINLSSMRQSRRAKRTRRRGARALRRRDAAKHLLLLLCLSLSLSLSLRPPLSTPLLLLLLFCVVFFDYDRKRLYPLKEEPHSRRRRVTKQRREVNVGVLCGAKKHFLIHKKKGVLCLLGFSCRKVFFCALKVCEKRRVFCLSFLPLSFLLSLFFSRLSLK